MISPLTLLTASLKLSTLAAISLANLFLPSSLILSASSLRLASSNSSPLRVVGPLNKKLLRTGLEAIVLELIRLCRYARSVNLFFSRARREGPTLPDRGEPGSESVLKSSLSVGKDCREADEEEVIGEVAGTDVAAVRSLAGGGRTVSSAWAFRSCQVQEISLVAQG